MAQIFRVDRTKNYTVMSNHHFKNKNLTLKAKGLLSLMLSLPDDWNYNMQGLTTLSRDGIDSVRSAIKELEHHGYVERHRLRNEYGFYGDTEYIIREVPLGGIMAIVKKLKQHPPLPPSRYEVGIYCRVSTASKTQVVSAVHQLSGLIADVANSQQARLYDVYLDIQSGRTSDNRKNLMRLLDDCRTGRVTLVYTKSISRFARNTEMFWLLFGN